MLGLTSTIQRDKFVSFLEKQTEEMTALMKKLGVI